MKYAFIEQNQQFYGVGAQCKILDISRSGYYAWQKRKKTDKKDHNQALIEHIRLNARVPFTQSVRGQMAFISLTICPLKGVNSNLSVTASPRLRISPSPSLRVSPSPSLRVSVSLLHRIFQSPITGIYFSSQCGRPV
jgi:hypothetical protein